MPDKKPSSDTIRKIIRKTKDVVNAPARAAGQFVLNRMAENLDPYNYGNEKTGGKSTIERMWNAVALNTKEPERAEAEQYLEKGYGRMPYVGFKERTDLLQLLANKPQKYNTVSPSQYRPTIGADIEKQYYDIPSIQEEIIKDLGLNEKEIRSSKDILDIIIPRATIDEKTGRPMIRRGGVTTTVPALGQATYGTKRDEKGRLYLSYGDVWDLDPQEGASAEDKKVSLSGIRSLEDLKDYGIGIGTDIVGSASSPTSVYGRIYFDEKTGKPILNNARAKMPSERIKNVLSKGAAKKTKSK